MNKNKIIKLPITFKQRMINRFGQGYVPCEVSNRWLQFPEYITDERYIPISVMTLGKDEKPKKICDLILSQDDIVRALKAMKIK